MSNIIGGYLKRQDLINEIVQRIEEKSKIPVQSGANQGYEIGWRFGYVEALNVIKELVKTMPDERKPDPNTKAWHHAGAARGAARLHCPGRPPSSGSLIRPAARSPCGRNYRIVQLRPPVEDVIPPIS